MDKAVEKHFHFEVTLQVMFKDDESYQRHLINVCINFMLKDPAYSILKASITYSILINRQTIKQINEWNKWETSSHRQKKIEQ